MAKFKGTIYLSTRMFTEQRFGPEAVPRVLSQLSPSDRELLEQVTGVGWYPVEPVLAFHYALEKTYGNGDLALCVQAGHFSAGWAINTVLKFLLKLRSPHWLVEKSGNVWDRYHDSGRWEFEPAQERRICGRLYDFAVRDDAFCARFRGWLAGAIELTGGRHPQVHEPRCGQRGQPCHEYVCTWS